MPDAKTFYGSSARGVAASDVSHAADTLLRAGNRPSVEKIRAQLGGGSPNTINPLLDAWWKTLSSRLDSGPAALQRLPESVAHVAEALWMQALDEGRRRAHQELSRAERVLTEQQHSFEVRSHVLTLREGELDSRLKDREKTIDVLSLQLRELNLTLRKERATCEAITRRLRALEDHLLRRTPKSRPSPRSVRTTKTTRRQPGKGALKLKKSSVLKRQEPTERRPSRRKVTRGRRRPGK